MRNLVRPIFAAAFVALLASSTVSTDVFAAKAMVHENFDGAWSVVINTVRGDCGSGLRYGVRIVGGRVVGENGGYSVAGAVAPNGAIRVMVPRNNEELLTARIDYTGPVPVPISKGQKIGTLKVWRGDNLALDVPVVAAQDVGAGSMPQRAIDGATELVIGLLRAGFSRL